MPLSSSTCASCTATIIGTNRIDTHVPPALPTESSHSSVHQSIAGMITPTSHVAPIPTTTVVKGKWARSQVFRKFLFDNFECLRNYAEWTRDSDGDKDDGEDEDESNMNNLTNLSARCRENKNNTSTNTTLERLDCDGSAAAVAGSSDFATTTTTACTNTHIPSTVVATSSSCGTKCLMRARAYVPYILDVAGGKGDVAIPLKIRGLRCGIVDPRVVDLENTKLMKNVKYHLEDMNGETKTGRAILRRLRQSADLQRGIAMEARAGPPFYSDSASVLSSSPSASTPSLPLPFLHVPFQSSIQSERLPHLTDQYQHTCNNKVELPDVFREWFTSCGPRSRAQEGEDEGIGGISLLVDNNTQQQQQQAQQQLSRRARRRARAKEAVGATTEVGVATENCNTVCEEDGDILNGVEGREGQRQQQQMPTPSPLANPLSSATASSVPSSQRCVQQYVKAHAESHGLSRAKAMCDIVIGMHPDQATEPIVDFALAHRKPFAIVPCCVFPKENPHRRVAVMRGETDEKEMAPVETYEQFIEYLVQKAPAGVISKATLPIDGRNIVLYCDSYPPLSTVA